MSKEKKTLGQHIQSYARVRPFNKQEIDSRAKSCLELQNKEVLLNLTHASKRFCFDKVFDEDSKQVEVYNAVVEPLLCEVMKGYNCTVFAYGQTGTGKTYTMIGDHNRVIESATYFEDSHVGIIPRVLSNLFDKYVKMSNITVRVSYLELYNEILIDLLSVEDKVLKLYEDPKSKGTVHIHGLEEVTVHDKNQVYEILRLGSERKITASTLMNVQSSRSHTVFTVTVHVRETMPDGEELVKTGKLHLVDLAGSENISKSGATDRRAREAGSINQSLLTLGRVIKTLVEKSAHVPYRESKLTRILQDSLGGKTKTAIIATVSPASVNVEETHSALEYAYRARVITNRPEINERTSKSALIQKYVEEIDKLKKDLRSARTRDGVYLHLENYEEMISESNKQKAELLQAVTELSVFAGRISDLERVKQDLLEVHSVTKKELTGAQMSLAKSKSELVKLSEDWHIQQNLIDKYDEAQTDFHQYNKILSDALNKYVLDYRLLRNKVNVLRKTNDVNHTALQELQRTHKSKHDALLDNVAVQRDGLDSKCEELKGQVGSLCAALEERDGNTRRIIGALLGKFEGLKSREVLTRCEVEDVERLEGELKATLGGTQQTVTSATGNIAEHLNAIVEKVDDIVRTGKDVTAKVQELRRGFRDVDERRRKGEENLMETMSEMWNNMRQTMLTQFAESRQHSQKYSEEVDSCVDYTTNIQKKNETTQQELNEHVFRGEKCVEEINHSTEAATARNLNDYKSLLEKYAMAVEHSNDLADRISKENVKRDIELRELSQSANSALQNLQTISSEYGDFGGLDDELTKRITNLKCHVDDGYKTNVQLVSDMEAVVDGFVEQYQVMQHEGDTPQKEHSIPKMKTPQLVKKDLFLRRRRDISESPELTNGSETIREESDASVDGCA